MSQHHGTGARGFNLYDGSLRRARFENIRTHGDGAVGIQVSKELAGIAIRGDVLTSGGEGVSLVKGVQTKLRAIALSIQPGGRVGRVAIGGKLATLGDGVVTLEVDGELGELHVAGGIAALGRDSDAVQAAHEIRGLEAIDIQARDGRRLVSTVPS